MTNKEIRNEILSQLTEDYTGLWELAGTEGMPPLEQLIKILDDLIVGNLAAIYLGTEFSSEERLLPTDEARRLIQDRSFWEWAAPDRGPHLRALATQSGADRYFRRAQHGGTP